MLIIKNDVFPPDGYLAINVFGVVFCRKDMDEVDLNHEKIHSWQIFECAILFAVMLCCLCVITSISFWWILTAIPSFYIWYGIEWLIRLCIDYDAAYRSISFEKEAYDNENNLDYVSKFGWFKCF